MQHVPQNLKALATVHYPVNFHTEILLRHKVDNIPNITTNKDTTQLPDTGNEENQYFYAIQEPTKKDKSLLLNTEN